MREGRVLTQDGGHVFGMKGTGSSSELHYYNIKFPYIFSMRASLCDQLTQVHRKSIGKVRKVGRWNISCEETNILYHFQKFNYVLSRLVTAGN